MKEEKKMNLRSTGHDYDNRMAFYADGRAREQLEWLQSRFYEVKGKVSYSVFLRKALDEYCKQFFVSLDVEVIDEWDRLKAYVVAQDTMQKTDA
jgi:hypothetical protein